MIESDISTLGDLLTPDELRKIIEVTDKWSIEGGRKLMYAILIRMYAMTGRRRNEILQLKVKDIDFDAKLIDTHIQKLKKKAHSRYISIDDKTLEMLKTYIKKFKLTQTSLLFPISEKTAINVVHRCSKEAGINKRVTIHSFRYSLITSLKIAGYTNEQISLITGQNPMTIRHYDKTDFFDIKENFEEIRKRIYGV